MNHLSIECSAYNHALHPAHIWGNGRYPVSISHSDNTVCRFFSSSIMKICIVGSPIWNEKIDPAGIAEQILYRSNGTDTYRQINGEFLIILLNNRDGSVKVINSRFASPIFFYVAQEDLFYGTTSYHKLRLRMTELGRFHLNTKQFYELFLFKRLFGDKTHDEHSKYLKPAHIIEYAKEGTNLTRYWKPNYIKNKNTIEANAVNLHHAIKTAIKRKTSDSKRYGLFLSGGMDSRTILANFKQPPHCFTVTYSKNREYRVAHQLALWKNAGHTWIRADNELYHKYFTDSVKTTSVMYLPGCLFYGHQGIISEHADIIFAGYGFDYFFQGMYLPAKFPCKKLPFKILKKIDNNLTDYFIHNTAYHTKGFLIHEIVRDKCRLKLNEYFRNVVSEDLNEGRQYSPDLFDILEYVSFGNLSRHYTYGGQLALMNMSELRIVSHDNDIYDLYLQMPVQQRFDARILREVLKMSNHRFYTYISANTGFPIRLSSFNKSFWHIGKELKKRLSLNGKNHSPFQRTFKSSEDILRNEFHKQVLSLYNSEEIESLKYIDMDKLRKYVDLWENNQLIGDQTLLLLVAINCYLKI